MNTINEETKRIWRNQHIQTRMLALQANLNVIREMQCQLAADQLVELIQLECVFHAAWEGRHAAARWLIEFVGVKGLKNGKAIGVSVTAGQENDFVITDVGGVGIDLNSADAVTLAQLRRDINKATSHPTYDSGHEHISEARLHDAATIIKAHLQKTLYSPEGETLY